MASMKSADEAGARFSFRHRPDNPGTGKGQRPLPNVQSSTGGLHSAKSARRFWMLGRARKAAHACEPALPQRANAGKAREKSRGRDDARREQDANLLPAPCGHAARGKGRSSPKTSCRVRREAACSDSRLACFHRKVDAQKLDGRGEGDSPREPENIARGVTRMPGML